MKLTPKKMLAIDAWGAGITILVLALVLEPFQQVFGMPMFALRIFSIIACIFCIYSTLSYYSHNQKHPFLLKVIAFGNTFYGLLIAFFVLRYLEKLTIMGRCYFAIEITIILGLVITELKTAYKKNEE